MDDIILFGLVIVFAGQISMALVCTWVAGLRGRDKITWGLYGLVIGLIALILLLVLPSKE